MESKHVVIEDYDSYTERKKKSFIRDLKWIAPTLLLIMGIFIGSSGNDFENSELIIIGGVMIFGAIVWYIISLYLTFKKK